MGYLLGGIAPLLILCKVSAAMSSRQVRDQDRLGLTTAQCRAGRALVGWDQTQLAEASGVSRGTIVGFESGRRIPIAENLGNLKKALEDAGVKFINTTKEVGVVLRIEP